MGKEKNKKTVYDIKYAREKLKRVPLDLQIDYYNNVLKPAAERAGLPVNTFIKNAIQEKIDKENNNII